MDGHRRVEYLLSQRGPPQVFLDGHLYSKNAVRQTCRVYSLEMCPQDLQWKMYYRWRSRQEHH